MAGQLLEILVFKVRILADTDSQTVTGLANLRRYNVVIRRGQVRVPPPLADAWVV